MAQKSKKTFLKIPEYPGGKKAFKKYIIENLMYPAKALENRVEGIVYLNAEINDNGDVLSAEIEKGIGYGCDEEAIRLIKGIKFGGVRNKGLRLKSKKKFRIEFKLPQVKNVNYSFQKKEERQNSAKPKVTYGYSIDIPKNETH